MTLTLEDIARLSGVSRSTVSRVINGDQKVREETRLQVLEVIQEHNYQPNIAARRLAAGRTNVIGLVIPTGVGNIFNDPYFSRLIQGVSAECNAREFSVMLWLAEPEYERRTIRQIINNGIVDGVVVSSTQIDDPIVNSLYESGIPFVLIGHHPTLNITSVDIDNIQAARNACTHLFTCLPARLRPATITGPQNTMAGRDRLTGFLQAIAENNLQNNPDLITEGDFSESGGYLAMQILLPARPDAVFVASDSMAAGAFRAIREAGLNIPKDISVVGFDDVAVAAQLDPPLTTIRQPIHRMGTQAVEMLIQIVQQTEKQPRQIILPSELIIRASSGYNH
ncbi:MAG: LacI family DNA-binding transcriptional regulator [Chloroflexi bacterium]|nr:LacI family DNA-binding transcriptional regulator [Chloroflexota bacterium]